MSAARIVAALRALRAEREADYTAQAERAAAAPERLLALVRSIIDDCIIEVQGFGALPDDDDCVAPNARWLTAKEAAGLAGVHLRTIRRWLSTRELPNHATKKGRVEIRRDELLTLAAEKSGHSPMSPKPQNT